MLVYLLGLLSRKLLKYAMDTIDGVGARALLNTENVKKLFLHVHSTAISDFLIEVSNFHFSSVPLPFFPISTVLMWD